MMAGISWPPQHPAWVPHTGQVIVKQAHPTNWGYEDARGNQVENEPRALVVHTPEEDADDIELTPRYFAMEHPDHPASTNDYTDSDGDLYEMVPHRYGAYGNGVRAEHRVWKGDVGASPPWRVPGRSLNLNTLSNEVEGRASTIGEFGASSAQWYTLVNWVAFNCMAKEIECDREFVVGHYELDTRKTDPGKLNLDILVIEAIRVISRAHIPGEPVEFDPTWRDEPSIAGSDVYRKVVQPAFEGRVRGHEWVEREGVMVPSYVVLPE